jgi:hypothetical protein
MSNDAFDRILMTIFAVLALMFGFVSVVVMIGFIVYFIRAFLS